MATSEDIWDDVHLNAIHEAHVEAGENHWFSCPMCDDEEEPEASDEDEREPVSCIGPRGLRVLKEQCSTCIFRPGNLMHLNSGRLKDMVDSVTESQTYVICHQTLDQPVGAVCRGSYEKVYTNAIQVAERLGFIEYVEGPTK